MGRWLRRIQLPGLPYCINVQMNQATSVHGTTTTASAPIAAHP